VTAGRKLNNKATEQRKKPAVERFNRLLSSCSLGCLQRIGRGIGRLAALGNNRLSRTTADNLLLAFPEQDSRWRRRLYHASLQHTGCALTETALLWHRPMEAVLSVADSSGVCAAFDTDPRPRIVIAPHLGNWEFLNLWLSQRLPLMSLYKPARNPQIDRYIRLGRTRSGAELLPVGTAGLRAMLRGLSEGKSCLILPDQRPGKGSSPVLSRFFGQTVDSSPLVSRLAARTDCSLYLATAIRRAETPGFKIIIRSMDRLALNTDVQSATEYLDQRIEALVREYPEQYQWAYKRFRPEAYAQLSE